MVNYEPCQKRDPSPPSEVKPVKTAAPDGGYVVSIVRGIAAIEPHIEAWQRLADGALESNVFDEPWVLLPAVEALGLANGIEFLLVHKRGGASPAPLPCGLFPFERLRRFKGLPVSTLCLWRREYCSLGVPLLLEGHALGVLEAVFDLLASDDSGYALIDFPLLPTDGPFYGTLSELIYRRRLLAYTAEQYTRAMIRPPDDPETYLAGMMSGKTRSSLRRKHKQLVGNRPRGIYGVRPGFPGCRVDRRIPHSGSVRMER